MRLRDFPVLTFDTYGTLIDWETGIWDALQPLRSRLRRSTGPGGRPGRLRAGGVGLPGGEPRAQSLLYAELLSAVHRSLARPRWGTEPDGQREHPLQPVGRRLAREFLLARVAADFGAGPESILHVAQSLFHDHVPAAREGRGRLGRNHGEKA